MEISVPVGPGADEDDAVAVAAQRQIPWPDHPPSALLRVKGLPGIAEPFTGEETRMPDPRLAAAVGAGLPGSGRSARAP